MWKAIWLIKCRQHTDTQTHNTLCSFCERPGFISTQSATSLLVFESLSRCALKSPPSPSSVLLLNFRGRFAHLSYEVNVNKSLVSF